MVILALGLAMAKISKTQASRNSKKNYLSKPNRKKKSKYNKLKSKNRILNPTQLSIGTNNSTTKVNLTFNPLWISNRNTENATFHKKIHRLGSVLKKMDFKQ